MSLRVLVAALAVVLLAACGRGSESSPQPESTMPSGPPAPSATTPPPGGSVELDGSPAIEEIRQRGKLMVGLRSNDPAFAVRQGPGQYGGFDVEVAKILAAGIGLDPKSDIAYRWLPPSLLTDAMSAGNVDVQIGGFDPATPKTAEVGPYIVIEGTRHFIGIRPGDDAMRTELQRILDSAVADGRWQHAYDATLGSAGIQGTPP